MRRQSAMLAPPRQTVSGPGRGILRLTAAGRIGQAARVPACTLELKIIPNAPHDEIAGWLGNALKVKVHAPALEGRANEALLEFLAAELGVPRRAVVLLRGDKSRHKVVRIDGLDAAGLRVRLGL